jgi:hypothetical protein
LAIEWLCVADWWVVIRQPAPPLIVGLLRCTIVDLEDHNVSVLPTPNLVRVLASLETSETSVHHR